MVNALRHHRDLLPIVGVNLGSLLWKLFFVRPENILETLCTSMSFNAVVKNPDERDAGRQQE